MQVCRPGKGAGRACALPHRRPNWVAMLTDVKKTAVAGGSSAFAPSCKTRLTMCVSGRRVIPVYHHVNRRRANAAQLGAGKNAAQYVLR